MNIVYLKGVNVMYQPLTFTSSDTLDHQIDIIDYNIVLFYERTIILPLIYTWLLSNIIFFIC